MVMFSAFPYDMAHGFRYGHDPDSGPLHHHPRLSPQRPHEPGHLHVSIALTDMWRFGR